MIFENTASFATSLDNSDSLRYMRDEFLFPEINGQQVTYLCGNSLGLQPRSVRDVVGSQLSNWEKLGVEGWFEGVAPWMFYHKELKKLIAPIVGASAEEVCPMNTLTVNLHLLLVSFYKPVGSRYKVIMEKGAFPSDQYAIESQVKFHGYDPKDAIIEVGPRKGEFLLRSEDILKAIDEHSEEVALVLFGGINYVTGQLLDMAEITAAGHLAGAVVGFDLAHAAGNVPLSLHDWQVDFACWCSYKYQNAGPGGIGGIFVHSNHFQDPSLHRFAGWWGYKENTRFKMEKGFVPEPGADGWQISCTQVIPMAIYHASLKLFERAGYTEGLRSKSKNLTAYLYFIINQVNIQLNKPQYSIITPEDPEQRGAQLSIIAQRSGKEIFDGLVARNLIGDWREPNVIRLSPVPLYNSFMDVFETGRILLEVSKEMLSSYLPFLER